MHDEHIPDDTVLGILLSRHPALVTFDDLVRELVDAPEERRVPEPFVHDAVATLVGDGLALRFGIWVVPTRAAVRAQMLICERVQ